MLASILLTAFFVFWGVTGLAGGSLLVEAHLYSKRTQDILFKITISSGIAVIVTFVIMIIAYVLG